MKLKTWTTPDLTSHNINDGTNYSATLLRDAYGLPATQAIMGKRQGYWPIFSQLDRPGKQLFLNVVIVGTPADTLQTQLMQWFDPDVGEESVLTLEDDAGGNDRYVEAICENLTMLNNSSGLEWLVTLRVSEDVFYRESTPSTDTASIVASGGTKVLTNSGDMNAFPLITITPTDQKSSSEAYSKKRFVTILWNLAVQATAYPTDIVNNAFDTATEIAAGNMQADGDDLRVFVNGVEADRWLDDINTADTSVWVNMDFAAAITLTLNGALGTGDTEIVVAENIDSLPASGIIKIDSEIITYITKNNQTKTIEECARGAKGTTAATHTTTTTIYWVQHDIWILYGNSSAVAPVADDLFQPMFELATSSNTVWDYDEFLTADGKRTSSWIYSLTSVVYKYGGNQGTLYNADPFVELGLEHEGQRPVSGSWGRGFIYIPAGITNANFQNCQKKCDDKNDWPFGIAEVQSSSDGLNWISEYAVPVPTANDTWEAWSVNQALTAGSKYVSLFTDNEPDDIWLEAADITLTITNPFTITLGSVVVSYQLTCTITNNTTGSSFSIIFPMLLNEDLVIDTDEKTLVYDIEGTNQFSALTVVGGPRRDWLPLLPGTNTIQYDEEGLVGVDLAFSWEERFYQ